MDKGFVYILVSELAVLVVVAGFEMDPARVTGIDLDFGTTAYPD